jgi:hypothetical protein
VIFLPLLIDCALTFDLGWLCCGELMYVLGHLLLIQILVSNLFTEYLSHVHLHAGEPTIYAAKDGLGAHLVGIGLLRGYKHAPVNHLVVVYIEIVEALCKLVVLNTAHILYDDISIISGLDTALVVVLCSEGLLVNVYED